jgi:hypothetical protein
MGARATAAKRGGTESELVAAIREAVNLQADVRVRRNNSGKLQDRNGRWVQFGQGVGSPDLMGALSVGGASRVVAQCFHLEVKRPGETPSADQLAWHVEARGRGEFVAVVHSVAEALAACARARAGELQ